MQMRGKRALTSVCLVMLGVVFAAAPAGVRLGAGGMSFEPTYAFARGGSDDRSTDDKGSTKGRHGADDKKADDRGGKKGKGSDDRKGDDHGGKKAKRSDDKKTDDHGRKTKGSDDPKGDDHGGKKPTTGSKAKVVKVERGSGTIEVVYSNGTKEEIDHGRYERKNAAGKTIVQRRATTADRARLKALAA